MHVLTVKLPDELERALERAAIARGVSKSHLAREAISSHLARPRKNAKRSVSALDLAGDLVGIVRRSPRGLATDPEFLSDFGER